MKRRDGGEMDEEQTKSSRQYIHARTFEGPFPWRMAGVVS